MCCRIEPRSIVKCAATNVSDIAGCLGARLNASADAYTAIWTNPARFGPSTFRNASRDSLQSRYLGGRRTFVGGGNRGRFGGPPPQGNGTGDWNAAADTTPAIICCGPPGHSNKLFVTICARYLSYATVTDEGDTQLIAIYPSQLATSVCKANAGKKQEKLL